MPRKSKKEEEKEEILRKLAEDLRASGETEEDSEPVNLSERDFSQFISQPLEIESGSPVLERVTGEQVARPVFVGTIPADTRAIDNSGDREENFKYVPGADEPEGPKYVGPQETAGSFGERVDVMGLGRRQEVIPNVNQEALFEGASESRRFQSSAIERAERPERFDVAQAGRRDPFEREDVKYQKYKPKLPDSH